MFDARISIVLNAIRKRNTNDFLVDFRRPGNAMTVCDALREKFAITTRHDTRTVELPTNSYKFQRFRSRSRFTDSEYMAYRIYRIVHYKYYNKSS